MLRLAAVLLLAGCSTSLPRRLAAAEPGAKEEWSALTPARQFEVMREGLRGGDAETRRIAALALDPRCLTLEEIRLQMAVLRERPDELWEMTTAPRLDFVTRLTLPVGSPDLPAIWKASLRVEPSDELVRALSEFHRAALPSHIPELVALLPESGELFPILLWQLQCLASETDEHRADVARGFLEALGCPVPPDPLGLLSKETFVTLADAAWLSGGSPVQRIDAADVWLGPPTLWLLRWADDVAFARADAPFLARVTAHAEHPHVRAWAARRLLDVVDDVEAWAPGAERARPAHHGDDFAPPEDARESWRIALEEARRGEPSPDDVREDEWRMETEGLSEVRDRAAAVARLDRLAATDDGRDHALPLLAKLGEKARVEEMIETWEEWEDRWALGRVRDPRVVEFLRGSTEPEALDALSTYFGLEDPGYSLRNEFHDADWTEQPFAGARRLLIEGKPVEAVLRLAERDDLKEWAAAALAGVRDPAAIAFLRRMRAEQWRGVYWVATAALATSGDAAAMAEWRAFVGEDRIWLIDGLETWNTRRWSILTAGADDALVRHWVSRISTNCCLKYYAYCALSELYPTIPLEHEGPGDGGRKSDAIRAWFERHRFRRSEILGGLVPLG